MDPAGPAARFPTEITSIFAPETLPGENNNDIHSGRNPRFLLRTLHRRFPPNRTVPRCLKVHIATVKDHNFEVETYPYKRRKDIRCMLCANETPMKNRETLWVHCLRKHFEYNPKLIRSTDGMAHLLLYKNNKSQDNTFSREKTTGVSHLLYCHRAPFQRRSEVLPPNDARLPGRTYYDSVSKIPKSEAKWLLDLDSDDEAKDHLRSLPDVDAEIDDYTDVTPGQKRFMKAWNYFLAHKSEGVTLARKYLPRLCMEFAQHWARSSDEDDEKEFVCFLFNLMDENQLGSLQMTEIMTVYRRALELSRSKVAAVTESSISSPTETMPTLGENGGDTSDGAASLSSNNQMSESSTPESPESDTVQSPMSIVGYPPTDEESSSAEEEEESSAEEEDGCWDV